MFYVDHYKTFRTRHQQFKNGSTACLFFFHWLIQIGLSMNMIIIGMIVQIVNYCAPKRHPDTLYNTHYCLCSLSLNQIMYGCITQYCNEEHYNLYKIVLKVNCWTTIIILTGATRTNSKTMLCYGYITIISLIITISKATMLFERSRALFIDSLLYNVFIDSQLFHLSQLLSYYACIHASSTK